MMILYLCLLLAAAPSLHGLPCSLREMHNNSTILALEVNKEPKVNGKLVFSSSSTQESITVLMLMFKLVAAVTVHTTVCPDLETVGASWYRVYVVGPSKDDGAFEKPSRLSSAILKDNVREHTWKKIVIALSLVVSCATGSGIYCRC